MTLRDAAKSIISEGLMRHGTGGRAGPAIHLCDSPESARIKVSKKRSCCSATINETADAGGRLEGAVPWDTFAAALLVQLRRQ